MLVSENFISLLLDPLFKLIRSCHLSVALETWSTSYSSWY